MTKKELVASMPKFVIQYPKNKPKWVSCSDNMYWRYYADNGKVVWVIEVSGNQVAVQEISTKTSWAWVEIRALKLL